jgi:hypothetical protein
MSLDTRRLPFTDGSFDAVRIVLEMARVARRGEVALFAEIDAKPGVSPPKSRGRPTRAI